MTWLSTRLLSRMLNNLKAVAPVSIQEAGAYTYILACSDGSLYTGYTVNLAHRLSVHNAGRASKYTRCRLPVRLVYYESFKTKGEAMSRECAIKKLSRREKLCLIMKKHGENLF